MGFIYKVTNSINGKVYIGQTSRTIEIRWKEHLRDSSDKPSSIYVSRLHNAIRKYGENAFLVECVEKCPDDCLDEREQYWIEYYKSCVDGYNISRGGQGKPLFRNADILDAWGEGLSVKQISEKLSISKQTVAKRLKSNGVKVYEILSRGNKVGNTLARRVVRISLDGASFKVYDSLTDASEENGITPAMICTVCSGERNSTGGYRWQYYDGGKLPERFEPLPKNKYPKLAVHQYALDGTYIRSFDSMSKAAKSVGKKSVSTIRNNCNKRKGIGYGYIWRYEKYDILPEFVSNC